MPIPLSGIGTAGGAGLARPYRQRRWKVTRSDRPHAVLAKVQQQDAGALYVHLKSSPPRLAAALYRPSLLPPEGGPITLRLEGEALADFSFEPTAKEANPCARTPDPGFAHAMVDLSRHRFGQSLAAANGPSFPVKIEFVDAAGVEAYPFCRYFWQGDGGMLVPPQENITRVAGPLDRTNFLLSGATWFHNLQRLVELYLHTTTQQLDRMLDWGCGCARILRHFVQTGHDNVYGCDIDPLNVWWVRESLPGCGQRVINCAVDPPLPYESSSFDVIYGHSVFTHLGPAEEHAWLAELHRILKPGGHAFMTYCGEIGVALTKPAMMSDDTLIARYLADGIIDLGANPAGVDAVQRPGYYRQIAHTQTHIERSWGQVLDLVGLYHGFAHHQSLAVLRKG